MTNAAREVLEDCRIALTLLEEKKTIVVGGFIGQQRWH
jgi:aspartokinase